MNIWGPQGLSKMNEFIYFIYLFFRIPEVKRQVDVHHPDTDHEQVDAPLQQAD